ncbi:MAG: WbuC family cupin fold metalloprotein [Prevotellaceae bacterium]|nr:WbuC family cupin fold metalloprotein [Prevotellaceae bacterium]
MKIDITLLNSLSAQAKANPRLRQAYDLRTTPEDDSQRILNAMEPGTVLPIHRHRGSTETVVVLRGKIRQNFYDEVGQLVESFEVSAGSEIVGFSVELGRWHNTECLESGTVILECKDGRYEALGKEDIMNL